MCGSCFLIHSAILCLLIGAFNPFTFKVIIDRYLFITDSLYLCSSLFLSFPSFPYSSPFSISSRAGLVEVYSFSLLLSGKLLIWPSLLIEAVLGNVVLVAGLWFSLLGIFFAILIWLGGFPLRSSLLTLLCYFLFLPGMLLPISPLLPLRSSLCLGILPF